MAILAVIDGNDVAAVRGMSENIAQIGKWVAIKITLFVLDKGLVMPCGEVADLLRGAEQAAVESHGGFHF